MAKTYDELEAQIQTLRKQQRAIKKAEQKKLKAEREKFEQIRNQKVYDAMHGYFTQMGVTDEMIVNMDAKTELRNLIFKKAEQK